MTKTLFDSFNKVSSKEWKAQIQFELKGADYNDTLVWESLEGIKVKPFYHHDEDFNPIAVSTKASAFKILQEIYVFDLQKSINKAIDSLERGAETFHFTIDTQSIDCIELLKAIPFKKTEIYITLGFLSFEYVRKIENWIIENNASVYVLVDPIAQLAKDGNWFTNLNEDFSITSKISRELTSSSIAVNTEIYQNAGATIVQQIAYTLAHLNEYFNRIPQKPQTIIIQVAVGTNYFFEIAKLRALRLVLNTLAAEYHSDIEFKILAKPSKRNKTIYDYNVNMLRTTTECMSAILGGADAITNLAYDVLFHKDNEFGDRISRNQLLILKEESYFNSVDNPAEGAYYIENLTHQLAEKGLTLFKDIERNGGFITQLIEGTIQRKISQSAEKEQELFDQGKEILLGTNKYPNPQDTMSSDLELYPFVKVNPRKTLIVPIIPKRLAEKTELKRLEEEKKATKQ